MIFFIIGICLTGVDKIVGFALSHHLKNKRPEALSKDAKLVLSSERCHTLTFNVHIIFRD